MNECVKKYFRLKTTTDRPSHRQRAQISNYIRPANAHTHTHTHTHAYGSSGRQRNVALQLHCPQEPPMTASIVALLSDVKYNAPHIKHASNVVGSALQAQHDINKIKRIITSSANQSSSRAHERNEIHIHRFQARNFPDRKREREREKVRASRQNAISCDVCTYIPGDTVTGLRTDDIPVSQSHFDPECTLFAAT